MVAGTVAGERCERLLSERIRGLEVSDVSADEIWGYVWCKEQNRPTDSPFIGDAYCFVGMENNTKLILAWPSPFKARTFAMRSKIRAISSLIMEPSPFSTAYTPEGNVSAGSPIPHSAVNSSGSTARVWSKWMTASN